MILVGVLLAGAAGASARALVERWTPRPASGLPAGTLLVNVSGSFTLGIITGLALAHGLAPSARTIAGTGFLGGYTTFSTYVYEIVRQTEDGRPHVGGAYLLVSLVLGVATAALGLVLVGA